LTTAITEAHQAVAQTGALLRDGSLKADSVDTVRAQTSAYRRMARDCIDRQESKIAALTRNIDTLGPADGIDNAPISAARRTLELERNEHGERLAECKLLLVDSDAILSELDGLQERELAARLTTRSVNVLTLWTPGGASTGSMR
jgi:hypothetical protein